MVAFTFRVAGWTLRPDLSDPFTVESRGLGRRLSGLNGAPVGLGKVLWSKNLTIRPFEWVKRRGFMKQAFQSWVTARRRIERRQKGGPRLGIEHEAHLAFLLHQLKIWCHHLPPVLFPIV